LRVPGKADKILAIMCRLPQTYGFSSSAALPLAGLLLLRGRAH
jgi:hypothetical protein